MSKPITIGRNPSSTICVSEEYDIVSNDHAEIVQQGGELTFIDHSSNGTIINGQKIKGRSVGIYPGDKIVLAGVCELSWDKISTFIIPVGRPTVARNIRGNGAQNAERRTSPISFTDQHQQQDIPSRNSRMTDFMPREQNGWRDSAYDYNSNTEERKPTTSSTQIDREVDKWNWGAFYFGWIWGIFNKVYISLLQLVATIIAFGLTLIGLAIISPFFSLSSLGISIWLGVKGSRMAWDNGAYRNLEHFRNVRHAWTMAAAIVFGISVFLIIISLLLFIDVISKMI